MKEITKPRAAWLRAVYAIFAEQGRPATTRDLADRTGTCRSNHTQLARCAVRDGQVSIDRGHASSHYGIRVTPVALAALGLPLVAYLAWPVGSGVGHATATHLSGFGIWPVSPLLALGDGVLPDSRMWQVASALAVRSDAVIVCRDRMLLGRHDVNLATYNGVQVSVVERPELLTSAAELWRPPLLQPSSSQPAR